VYNAGCWLATHVTPGVSPLRIDRRADCALLLQNPTVTPSIARAGERGTWTVSFSGITVAPGGRLRLRMVGGRWNKGDCQWPQISDPAGDAYVSARASNGAELNLRVPGWEESQGTVVDLHVGEPGISADARIDLVLGDASEGGDGMVLQTFSQPDKVIEVLVDNATGEFVEASNPPQLRILGGAFDRLAVLAPSTVAEGERFTLLLKAEDEFGNVAPAYECPIELDSEGARLLVEGDVAFTERDDGLVTVSDVQLLGSGVARIVAQDKGSGIEYASNPIHVVSGESRRLYWGSIHGHTAASDGTGTQEAYFENMRDANALDFGALADHDHLFETTDAMFEDSQRVTAQFNEADRFVALLGYEWAKWRRNGDGDRCVYYLNDHEPMYRSDEGHCSTPGDLFGALDRHEALIIPHHTACRGNFCDWKDHKPQQERLVEMYSCWGSSECGVLQGNPFPIRPVGVPDGGVEVDLPMDSGEAPVGYIQNALAAGWRVGFTAGGDDHHGHAGDRTPSGAEPFRYGDGLLAVWAERLDRPSIFEALMARRCYGTTGARMIIEFSVCGYTMGTDLPVTVDDPRLASREIVLSVSGEAPISRIEIVRNNKVVYQQRFEQADVSLRWVDDEPSEAAMFKPLNAAPFLYYYARVLQADGQMAWVSPVWLTLEG